MRVMVLGGTGFIGRHAAAALRAAGHSVLIGTRHPRRALAKLPPSLRDCDLRETHFEHLTTRYVWQPMLKDVDVVLNCAGIMRERGSETFDRVQHMAPAALALACERMGLRLVHVSALGLRAESRSAFLYSKWMGERAILASGADYSIARPSLLDGEGGFGARWLRRVAHWPVHFIPTQARGRMAVLQVTDLADALVTLCEARGREDLREVDLGGRERRTMAEHLAALRALTHDKPALRIPLPGPLALLAAAVCDLLHFSPYSFGHLELMRRDNAPAMNVLQALIGRAPAPVGAPTPENRDRPRFSSPPLAADR
jgi:uncharacterized protein YbjT (DUF2867 family)